MPSDSKKKRDQKKKEDAKKKVQPKKKQVDSEEQPCDNGEELEGVDVENGDETNGNGVGECVLVFLTYAKTLQKKNFFPNKHGNKFIGFKLASHFIIAVNLWFLILRGFPKFEILPTIPAILRSDQMKNQNYPADSFRFKLHRIKSIFPQIHQIL